MTLSDTAELTLLGWDTVKDIVKGNLAREYSRPALKGVRYLAIDEIHLGRVKRAFTPSSSTWRMAKSSGRPRGAARRLYAAFGGVCAWPKPRSAPSPPI